MDLAKPHEKHGVTRSLPSLHPAAQATLPRHVSIAPHRNLKSSLTLPRLQDIRKANWSQSAAVLSAHEEKLPFLRLPMPSREVRMVGEDALQELRHDRMRMNAKLQHSLKGNMQSNGSSLVAQPSERKFRPAPIVYHRKESQQAARQAALARDQQFVMSERERLIEHPDELLRREQQIDDHWWACTFAPISRPRQYLPDAFAKRLPVRSSAYPTRLGPGNPLADASAMFSVEEMQNVVDVCRSFAMLTSPPDTTLGGPLSKSSCASLLVLSRSSFCRLICALCGLSIAPGERTRLLHAVALFDNVAECIPVKGCSLPGGSVVGLQLGYGMMGMPKMEELTILSLFASLLRDMAKDVTGKQSRYLDQCQEVAHERFFKVLLPAAEKYAEKRAEYVQSQIDKSSKSKRALPPRTNSDNGIAPSISTAAASKLAGVSIKVPQTSVKFSIANSEAPSGYASHTGSDTEAEDQESEDAAGKQLYAHTCAVLKGEVLNDQMLEPEVLHLMNDLRPIFHSLFDAYADIPTSNTEGHMTCNAFLKFATDFNLFPSQLNFQTLEWLYNTAGSYSEMRDSRRIDVNLVGTSGTEISFLAGVEHRGNQAAGSKRKTVKARKTMSGALAQSKASSIAEPEPILWNSKWIRAHLAWIVKDLGEMSEVEHRSFHILWGMNEWVLNRDLHIVDVFVFLTLEKDNRSRDSVVTFDAFQKALDFMQLEDPPSSEEAQQLMRLIASPVTQELDLKLLKGAFMVINCVYENFTRAQNCFLKEARKMTQAEYDASIFFQELEKLLEKNKWSPEYLFKRIDLDGNGYIDTKELEREIKVCVKQQVEPSMWALSIEQPFRLLDMNSDGVISCEEFCLAFEQVKEARETKQNQEALHPMFLSTKSMRSRILPTTRVFGRRAFAECVVKIALAQLSFHGTAQQAEQSSLFKALWILLYLHWQYDGLKKVTNISDSRPHRAFETARSHFKKQLAPMERLLRAHPDLFSNISSFSTSSTGTEVEDGNATAWGSQVDTLLQKCLSGDHGHLSIDGMLLASVVD